MAKKSVQLSGEGMTLDEDQLPSRAAAPVPDGPSVLVRSYPKHPTSGSRLAATASRRIERRIDGGRHLVVLVMKSPGVFRRIGHTSARLQSQRGEKYTTRKSTQIHEVTAVTRHADFSFEPGRS